MSRLLAIWLPLAVPAAMAATLVAIRIGLLRPIAGFALFLAVWTLGGGAAAVVGLLARRQGAGGTASLAVGALLLAAAVAVALRGRGPAIHDISTSPEDPPPLVAAARLPENAGRDLSYPHGGSHVPEQQRRAYPEIGTLRLPLPADEAYALALRVVRELGWRITWSDPDAGRFEAYDISHLFRFVDDIAVRVRPAPGGGTEIDLRSLSRVGRSDLGANAARIRAFTAAVEQRTAAR